MRFSILPWGLAPLLLAAPLPAQEAVQEAVRGVPGAEVAGLVGGRTIQGSMEGSGPYAEYYDADGSIRGDGYVGAWTVEGDAMCFDYGDDPATCYGVAVDGTDLAWLSDGQVVGTGTIVEGNPNAF